MTTKAISYANKYLSFGKYTSSDDRNTVKYGSIWPDLKKEGISKWHGYSNYKQAIKKAKSELKANYKKNNVMAFKYLGGGAHTIQDYYAHTHHIPSGTHKKNGGKQDLPEYDTKKIGSVYDWEECNPKDNKRLKKAFNATLKYFNDCVKIMKKSKN